MAKIKRTTNDLGMLGRKEPECTIGEMEVLKFIINREAQLSFIVNA